MFAVVIKMDNELTIIQEENIRDLIHNLFWDISFLEWEDKLFEKYNVVNTRSIACSYYISLYGNNWYELVSQWFGEWFWQVCKSKNKQELIWILNELELQYIDFTL